MGLFDFDDSDDGQTILPGSPVPDSSPVGSGDSSDYSALAKPVSQQEVDDANARKRRLALLGAIGDTLSSQQSVGNFALGRLNPQAHGVSDVANGIAGTIQDPYERKKQLLASYQAAKAYGDDQKLRDPTSASSNIMRLNAQSAVGTLMKGAQKNPEALKRYSELQEQFQDPNVSASDIKSVLDKDPLFKEQFSAELAGQKADQQSKIWAARLGAENTRTNAMQDRIGLAAGDRFDKDKLCSSMSRKRQLVQGVAYPDAALKGEVKLTPQLFNEMQQDIAIAIATGGSHASSEQEATQFKSLELQRTNLMQYISGNPQAFTNPKVISQLKDVTERLSNALDLNARSRANQIAAGRSYKTASAQQAQDAKVQNYNNAPTTPQLAATAGPVPASPAPKSREDKLKFLMGD